jgi:hypothetical protein
MQSIGHIQRRRHTQEILLYSHILDGGEKLKKSYVKELCTYIGSITVTKEPSLPRYNAFAVAGCNKIQLI